VGVWARSVPETGGDAREKHQGDIDVLVSGNFKHIVNLKRIHAYNAVNLKRGYPLLEIRTPREIIDDE
jgi:hypothetical protein